MSAMGIGSDFFSAAYSQYHSEVESFLHKFLGYSCESEDLAQEISYAFLSMKAVIRNWTNWISSTTSAVSIPS